MKNFVIYRGDQLPNLTMRLTSDDAPVDLTTADSIHVIGLRNRTPVIDEMAVGAADGLVTMQWKPEHTAQTGDIRVDVEVVWSGKKRTFRPEGVIEVRPDYG